MTENNSNNNNNNKNDNDNDNDQNHNRPILSMNRTNKTANAPKTSSNANDTGATMKQSAYKKMRAPKQSVVVSVTASSSALLTHDAIISVTTMPTSAPIPPIIVPTQTPLVTPNIAPTPAPTQAPLSHTWQTVAESAVGMAHRRMIPAVPCQDASLAIANPRTILIVADGAGSAKLSHIGSTTLVQSLNRLLFAMEGLLIRFLDGEQHDSAYTKNLAEMIYRYAIHQMKDLGQTHQRSDRDFRATLLLAVAGKAQIFWLKVGDGELVYEDRSGKLTAIGERGKEEFANQTSFVDTGLSFDQVQYGSLSAQDITGLALMSDGAGERLVSNDGSKIANKLGQFLAQLRVGKLHQEQLFSFFNEADIWQGSTHDDKSLALSAR